MTDESIIWAMIFASVYGIGQHPRARDYGDALTPAKAAELTDAAMLEWRKRFHDDGRRLAE